MNLYEYRNFWSSFFPIFPIGNMQKLEIWDWFENSGVWLIESIPLDCVFNKHL